MPRSPGVELRHRLIEQCSASFPQPGNSSGGIHFLIFGLSFSSKYVSQNGQWNFMPDPSMCGLTTKTF
jgi:hypothetical protein